MPKASLWLFAKVGVEGSNPFARSKFKRKPRRFSLKNKRLLLLLRIGAQPYRKAIIRVHDLFCGLHPHQYQYRLN